MAERFLRTVLTPRVRDAQRHYYRRSYPEFADAPVVDPLGPDEIDFLQVRDSIYLATVTENGWPYVQHRGGPPGFLRALSATKLGFADYGGNRQLVSVGSLAANPRIALFAMDYPNRTRLKVLGHAEVLDARAHPELLPQFAPAGGHAATVERLVRIEVLSFDWNCQKFITPRYTAPEIEAIVAPLQARIRELEARLGLGPQSGPGTAAP